MGTYYTASDGNEYYHWSGGPVGFSPPGPEVEFTLEDYEYFERVRLLKEEARLERKEKRRKARKQAWENHLYRCGKFKKWVRRTAKKIQTFFSNVARKFRKKFKKK